VLALPSAAHLSRRAGSRAVAMIAAGRFGRAFKRGPRRDDDCNLQDEAWHFAAVPSRSVPKSLCTRNYVSHLVGIPRRSCSPRRAPLIFHDARVTRRRHDRGWTVRKGRARRSPAPRRGQVLSRRGGVVPPRHRADARRWRVPSWGSCRRTNSSSDSSSTWFSTRMCSTFHAWHLGLRAAPRRA